jgi:hypothetical protein
MRRWIVCPFQRPLRLRRSILFPVVVFMITTGLLYVLVEQYTLTTTTTTTTTQSSIISSQTSNCQLRNDTIRAMNLAPSDYCKQKLENISCQIDSIENFFPKSLPRFCPIQSKEK